MIAKHKRTAITSARTAASVPGSPKTVPRQTSLLQAMFAALAIVATSPSLADDSARETFTLNFAGEFAGQPFDCRDRYEEIGSTSASVALADYRLYISRVRLLDRQAGETPLMLKDDGRWQGNGVALLDFEDATGNCGNGTPPVNSRIVGSAPPGEYTGVAFDIGVPFDLNHADPTLAGAPLNLTAMFWNWRGGYRFMRLDLVHINRDMDVNRDMNGNAHGSDHGDTPAGSSGHSAAGWMLHIGSSGCVATTPTSAPSRCAAPNRISVVLDDFDLAEETVVIDPAKVLIDVDVSSNTPSTAPGCMSSSEDPECQAVLKPLGLAASDNGQTFVTER